jgi:O-antigen/teichoic acid export membrane protein
MAPLGDTGEIRLWTVNHIKFGLKALTNGFLAESYIRIDIIMLGIFVADRDVGIYSFAALFIEGLFQIPVIVRTIANPVLVRLLIAGDKLDIGRFSRKTALLSLGVFSAAAVAVLVIFPELAPFFPDQLVGRSYPVLMVLMAGLWVYSAFIPFDHALLQAGQPGRQSLLMTANVAANAALNLALIPFFGIFGAAVATALSFVISTLTVNAAAWKWLGFPGGMVVQGTRFEFRP